VFLPQLKGGEREVAYTVKGSFFRLGRTNQELKGANAGNSARMMGGSGDINKNGGRIDWQYE